MLIIHSQQKKGGIIIQNPGTLLYSCIPDHLIPAVLCAPVLCIS